MPDESLSKLMNRIGDEVAKLIYLETGRLIDFSVVVHGTDQTHYVSSGGTVAAQDLTLAAEAIARAANDPAITAIHCVTALH